MAGPDRKEKRKGKRAEKHKKRIASKIQYQQFKLKKSQSLNPSYANNKANKVESDLSDSEYDDFVEGTHQQPAKSKRKRRRKKANTEEIDLSETEYDDLVGKNTQVDSHEQPVAVTKSKRKRNKKRANKKEIDLSETEYDDLVEKKNTLVDSQEQPVAVTKSKRKKKSLRGDEGSTKSLETNFTKYLKSEMGGDDMSAHQDLMFERRLAKKLRVKNGRLTAAANDDLDALLDGIPSVLDTLEGNEEEDFEISDSDTVPGGSRKSKLVNEDMDDEISDEEDLDDGEMWGDEDEEISGESVNEDMDDEISGDEDLDDELGGDEDEEISGDEGSDEESDSSVANSEDIDDVLEDLPKDSNKVKKRKTKFEEYLESSTGNGGDMVEADLQLERKLAKKLKLNTKDVRGEDGMDMLLDGIPSVLDRKSVLHAKLGDSNTSEQKQKAQKKMSSSTGAYVAPHLRPRGGNESEEHAKVRRKIRGLLNRLSESNVESVTSQIAELYQSVGRSIGSEIICEEVVSSCAGGPRGNEQYAAVFGAFVAGMTCSVGVDFGAKLLARIAKCFEEEYMKEDNLSLRNVTLLLCFVYVFGVCSSELMYDFLIMLSKRLTEVDVSTVLTVLQCCGMNLRGDDPAGMKSFILSVQSRVNEMKASPDDGQSTKNSKRMEFMLETICDIKNNKKKQKEVTAQHTRVKKWLQMLRVDNILISGLKWSKLLDPTKKGQWWLSGDMVSSHPENVNDVSVNIDKEVPETKKMLELAAAQRMNTDARKAIFCVIMSGEDYIDAFEKLLRLELTGKQDREIMRVLVNCCLQEKIFNKYYCVLANKLCSHDKNHKFTLQYCLWDHFKELESMPLIRSMHLAKFVAEMIASFSLSLAVLKAVDFNDPLQLTAKRIMHFRLIFEGIFEFPESVVWNIFTRIAINPEYEPLRIGIKFFVSKYVLTAKKSLNSKFQIARKALSNAEGVIF